MSTIRPIGTNEEPPESSQIRAAITIGNSSYTFADPLLNPRNDAADMAELLRGVGFEVSELFDVDHKTMESSLDRFCLDSTETDLRVIYFAGHGIQHEGVNYLVPTDAELASEFQIKHDCVSVDRIIDGLATAERGASIVILDACRDNPFAASFRGTSRHRGLAPITAPAGFLICFATAPGSIAEDGEGRNGTYTAALLRWLASNDEHVMRQLQEVRRNVLKATDGQQVPWESTSLTSDLVLRDSVLANRRVFTEQSNLLETLEHARAIDDLTPEHASYEFHIPDRSTEGAAYEVWTEERTILKVAYVECWESGRIEEAFYVMDSTPRLIVTERTDYEYPLSAGLEGKTSCARQFMWLGGGEAIAVMDADTLVIQRPGGTSKITAGPALKHFEEARILTVDRVLPG